MQSAFAAALIVDEKGIPVAQENVARLEVAIEKVIARGAEKKFSEAAEIVLEGLFIEGDAGETEKIIFKIVQVPGDGLAVEAGDGIANVVIQIAARFDLEAGQDSNHFAIGFDDLRSNVFASAILGEEFEERGVAEVFLEIRTVAKIFSVDFRNGKAVTAKSFWWMAELTAF